MPENDDELIQKNIIASKINLQELALTDINDEPIDLGSSYVNITQIKRLRDYLIENEMTEGIDLSKLGDRWVVPYVLSDNRTIEIEVRNTFERAIPEIINQYSKDGELKKAEIPLFEEMLNKNFSIIGNTIRTEDLFNTFAPKDLPDLAKKLSDGELEALDDPQKIAKILNIQITEPKHDREETEISEEKELVEEGAIVRERSSEESEDEKSSDPSKKQKVNEISEEVSDDVSQLLSQDEELRKSGGRLKQVLEVRSAASIRNMVHDSDSLESTGLSDNQPVKIYRFTGGELLNDRIVMVQGSRIVDNRIYDRPVSEHMHNVGSPEVDRLKDNENKYVYTDNDGNKFVADLVRKPDDLSLTQKEVIERQLNEIDKQCLSIRNSDAPDDEKFRSLVALNQKRLNILAENGLTLPVVESEIKADTEQNNEEIKNAEEPVQPKKVEHVPEEKEFFGANKHYN